ncbi:MAG: prepilin peptidase [Erysipelotrichaceae bacterium]
MEIIFVFFIGAVFGSFINVAAYRTVRKKDFVFARSCCQFCYRQLSFSDMIPVISYLLKQGKCTYCKSKISERYLITELTGGINALVCFNLIEIIEVRVLFFIIMNLLLFMSLVDIETKEINDFYQLLLLILTVVIVSMEKWSIKNIIGMMIISLPLLILNIITESIGGADVKLFFSLGLLTEEKGIIVIYLLTIFSASIFALYRLKKAGNKKEEIALIPFIYSSFLIYKSFEKHLINWLILWCS